VQFHEVTHDRQAQPETAMRAGRAGRTLPEAIDTNELFPVARERGVAFSRGELFHIDGAGRNTMRLTYASVSPDQIDTGIAVLGELLRELWPTGSRESHGRARETVPIL
jgi:hypothetical protein